MNLRQLLALALLAIVPTVALACEEPRKRSSNDDSGDEDDGSSGQQNTSGDPSGTGAGASGSGPSTSSGGPSCAPGGAACEAFDDCCSGVCDNQICTECAGDGTSCAELGCCTGLSCYPGDNTCGSCSLDGDSCSNASDCCSNICDQGVCAAEPKCDVGDCPTCIETACAQNACSAPLAVCDANPECGAFLSCVDACADQACLSACEEEHPNGIDDAIAARTCLFCTPDVCYDDCDGANKCQ